MVLVKDRGSRIKGQGSKVKGQGSSVRVKVSKDGNERTRSV